MAAVIFTYSALIPMEIIIVQIAHLISMLMALLAYVSNAFVTGRVILTSLLIAYCGDKICDPSRSENCVTCAYDCKISPCGMTLLLSASHSEKLMVLLKVHAEMECAITTKTAPVVMMIAKLNAVCCLFIS